MYLVYTNNRNYPKVKSEAEQLASDDHQVRFRNPEYFSGPNEFRNADKVFVCGDYPDVMEACKEADVDCEPLGEQGNEEQAKADNDFESLPEDTDFPYHYGGGNYFLSDGSKISGKDKAQEAQEALNEATNG